MTPQPGKVLIVDDMPDNLNILMIFLKTQGYQVFQSKNGEKALEIAYQERPDIILLDVMMPGIDGFETCRRLKESEITKHIPVIFMTALSDTEHKIKGFEIGAVDYIGKPFQYQEVLARVKTHVTFYQQRKEIEALREQDRIYYENLSQVKDELMRTASHDLKSPLGNIMTSIFLLQDHISTDDEQGQLLIQTVQRGADRMLNLITELLDVARIEAGYDLNQSDVNICYLLQQMIQEHRATAGEKQITLTCQCEQTDITLHIDEPLMSRALQNLISNAVKYTPEGGQVTVIAHTTDDNVELKVIDTGLGIPEDALPQLFDKFYRVNNARHLKENGTGLGLNIVQTIVEQHAGTIQVESILGEGSTFTIALPK